MRDVTMIVAILLVVVAVVTTGALIVATLRMPGPSVVRDVQEPATSPPAQGDIVPRRRSRLHDRDSDDRGNRLRLITRVLFTRRAFDSITLDCTLVRVDGSLPPELDAPDGLPFTLRLRCPDTAWFAARVEELLNDWAEQNQELLIELRQDTGRVRTLIACGDSSVQLELAGAAGLDANRNA